MAGFVAEQEDDDKEKMKNRATERTTNAMESKARGQFATYSNVVKRNENSINLI